MALYFFDVHDGAHVYDEIGREFSDLEAVRTEAMQLAAQHAVRPKVSGRDGRTIFVTVRNTKNDVVLNAQLVFNIKMRGVG
ncbi:DUF6894 family protein [Methylobacterium haplocladii]|uniref:DUF6894 domain-containing protein n=1 Tax=Methylobacterium haplocladii TaxID=1176176 RepID=A0A512IVY8_9HYPH|nr:hypothetical protein [Methylobacterium haplocladii]GEP01846.1 hypothetical protein MHA02_42330 [Methylobacterium haplocladii]GJD86339.1 hypothetical protein HPGCJGGD_4245 [Methylobacterium haplocladii]GLS61068.1 hypothetical protein GCM10007887_37620 [Methylobacterium haplocladii]